MEQPSLCQVLYCAVSSPSGDLLTAAKGRHEGIRDSARIGRTSMHTVGLQSALTSQLEVETTQAYLRK
jgi:hypothetical protein